MKFILWISFAWLESEYINLAGKQPPFFWYSELQLRNKYIHFSDSAQSNFFGIITICTN